MPEESFLLVSLEEDKSKKLAQVLSNDTSRKILNLLSKKESVTETDISKLLKIPLSTAHYNIKQLVEVGLLEDDKYTYSKKGKEVVHYSIINKYVIIAPKKMEAVKEKLKKFLPVLFITAITGVLIKYFSNQNIMLKSASIVPEMDAVIGARSFSETVVNQTPPEVGLWFVMGSVFALVLYFVWAEIILKKK